MVSGDVPQHTDAELAEAEMAFMRPWTFSKSVPALEFLPETDRLEVAFAGRSNVGKSSLINALVNQKGLARASNTPGRTQELNFFLQLQSRPPFFIVDMPGYGFAEAPKSKVDAWTQLVKNYLRGRQTLARVFLLLDARHGVKPNDDEIMNLLDEVAVTYQVTLTKIDKIKPHSVPAVIGQVTEAIRRHPAAFPVVLATSSEKGIGMPDLRATILSVVRERAGMGPA